MKTLEEIKDEVSQEIGHESAENYLSELYEAGSIYTIERINLFINEVAIRTAKEALKNASENVKLTISEFSKRKDNSIVWNEFTLKENLYIINDGCNIVANKQSILNESNIPKL